MSRIQYQALGALRHVSSSVSRKLCSPLPKRGVLSVSGTDSSIFLNGIIAASVRDHPFYTAFLSAQGRVLYDVFIYPYNTDGRPGFLVDYDSRLSEATPLLSMLKRHVLRSKVRLRDVSEEWKVWAVWAEGASAHGHVPHREWRWGRSGAVEPVYAAGEHLLGPEYPEGGIGTRDLRAPNMGERLLIRTGDKPNLSVGCDLAHNDSQYILHRIANAVPEGQEDIVPQQAFPMDSNMDLMGGLDFRKGCYVGQELTVRTYHTGVIRKRIMPVSLIQEDTNATSDPVSTHSLPLHASIQAERLASSSLDTANRPTRPRGTGTLLSNVNGLGLALLRLEHVEGVERGELAMSLALPEGGKLVVQPRRPSWWPVATENELVK